MKLYHYQHAFNSFCCLFWKFHGNYKLNFSLLLARHDSIPKYPPIYQKKHRLKSPSRLFIFLNIINTACRKQIDIHFFI